MNESNLRNRLYELGQLKAEYGIGSQDAWNYMKTRDHFRNMKERISGELSREGIKYPLSVRDVSNMCTFLRLVIQLGIDMTEKRMQLNKNVPNNYGPMIFLKTATPLDGIYSSGEELAIGADYETLITQYIRNVVGGETEADAMMSVVLDAIKGRDFRCFRNDEGECFSFAEIIKCVYMMNKGSTDTEDNPIDEDTKGSLLRDLKFSEDQLDGFLEELRIAGHALFDRFTEEENTFLYKRVFNDNYKKAKRERTLGRLEVERRIAMNYIIGISDGPSELVDVEEAISDAQSRMLRIRERLERSQGFGAEERLEELGYVIRALRKNRAWLDRMLES